MNVNQRKMLNLLGEVIDLCEQGDIPWFVSGKTAMRLYKKNIFYKGALDIEITIPAKCINKFFEVFDSADKKDRVIESLANNPRMPGIFLRYVDTQTTLIRINEGMNYKFNGFYIKVNLLRNVSNDEKSYTDAMKIETLLRETTQYAYYTKATSKFHEKILFSFKKKIFGTNFTNKTFYKLMDIYSKNTKDVFLINLKDNGIVFFKEEDFKNKQIVMCEGMHLFIPKNAEDYFVKVYCNEWEDELEKIALEGPEASSIVEGANNVVSTAFSYNDFKTSIEKCQIDNYFFKCRKKNTKKNIYHQQKSALAREAWNLAQRAGDLLMIHEQYMHQKEYIRNLLNAGEIDELNMVFQKYDETVRKYKNMNMAFYYDEQLWDTYMEILGFYKDDQLILELNSLICGDSKLPLQIEELGKALEGSSK